MNSIHATVGILTFNNKKTIRRCLDSVEGFSEIIVADGGSKDGTRDVARAHGARVIGQTQQGKPIEDFSKERNHMLESATYDWFFYLDADEYMSEGLREEIRAIAKEENPDYLIYRVPYFLVDRDGKPYKQFKVYYQTRFFNKKSGARFVKPMHERIAFDRSEVKVGILKHPWYVPLDESDLLFENYRDKAHRRLNRMIKEREIHSFFELTRALKRPFVDALKQIYKMLYVRIRYPGENLLPFTYELFRLYSYAYTAKALVKRYQNIKGSHKI